MQIIKIAVTLRDVAPKVARTLEVPADIPLDRLHQTLQAAFGWQSAHLYQFCIGEPYQWEAERWVMPDYLESAQDLPADKTTLIQALGKAGDAGLTYLYDFGDDWNHDIHAAPQAAADPDKTYPRLTEIAGHCPPEDVGGPPGYEMFVEAMADTKHPEHKEFKAWHGGPFNPAKPDEKTLTANVAKLAKRWAKKRTTS
ncbi:plasmid pRiA4b ORF-3 family protein [Nitratireductor sp. CAU 1489]|uniref:Plasmid pRiA4b ORF-3 family protein n=1 Tax=Nitratireductor arenosus TaxID=2682096 RepID=A0A844QH45_9HYPH|nr:plasmid pRiA4b ORF-3 family protein [Nitratireductor arenosus]MVA97300.1 plasmid pRiA4b ORF-3 family protein [Nitratireductor arenosus]